MNELQKLALAVQEALAGLRDMFSLLVNRLAPDLMPCDTCYALPYAPYPLVSELTRTPANGGCGLPVGAWIALTATGGNAPVLVGWNKSAPATMRLGAHPCIVVPQDSLPVWLFTGEEHRGQRLYCQKFNLADNNCEVRATSFTHGKTL
jgi:hypothetical protein